ncbi:hypothetical protein MRX96_030763 [Rhipicephalus microplus]
MIQKRQKQRGTISEVDEREKKFPNKARTKRRQIKGGAEAKEARNVPRGKKRDEINERAKTAKAGTHIEGQVKEPRIQTPPDQTLIGGAQQVSEGEVKDLPHNLGWHRFLPRSPVRRCASPSGPLLDLTNGKIFFLRSRNFRRPRSYRLVRGFENGRVRTPRGSRASARAHRCRRRASAANARGRLLSVRVEMNGF